MLVDYNSDWVTRQSNIVVPIIMRRRFTKLERARILQIWLTEYCLPIMPRDATWFDRYHKTHGQTILHNTNKLHNVELRK